MTDNLPPQLYGIWMPRVGWLRFPAPGGAMSAYATARRDEAKIYARWLGHGAFFVPVDTSLISGEGQLLDAEKERALYRFQAWSKNLWDISINWLRSRTLTRR